ncbi:long-chain-fatty-acid--CoA ligase 1-like [Bolinopsis microptera]|uniref:long-chain-fatty-acid--CoA ligase 1-like n=1 Tax=Bolinopsis microptera TaxID=2820187 RepID=UPI003079EABD
MIAMCYEYGGQETLVGIFAKNSPQWHMTMQAATGNSNIAVPLYLTLGDKAMSHILKETGLTAVVCQNSSVERLLEFVTEGCKITTVISVGHVTDSSTLHKLSSLNIKCLEWDEVRSLGSKVTDFKSSPPTADDIAIICYTSGTTGKPKGAELTHKNIVSCMKMQWRQLWKFQGKFNKEETVISYLPLAHVYGFVAECIVLFVGGKIGYSRGDTKLLLDDIQELKPTIFPAVPRVLNKVYDKVNAQLDLKPFVVKNAFNYGVGCKVAEVEGGIVRNNSVWDTLFFKKIQDKLGGRVKIIMSGSAPMQDHVIQWFRAVMGTNIVEGYGQTETSAASSSYLLGDTVPGHVGVPGPQWQIKLVDVPEMGYFVKDNKGEVCVKGPGVFQGYYKQPELTAEVLKEGWLYSGDIGTWTPEGRLQLIDRKKNIFKLSQGEYIAPEKIEIVYERSPYVSQVYVYGESIKSSLIAVVVLDEEYLSASHPQEFANIPISELPDSKEFTDFVLDSMLKLGSEELNSLEQVKRIKLLPESCAFTIDNEMLTPTFKKKRHNIRENYRPVLDTLYKGID